MAEHTPGPWRVKYHESSPDQIAAVVSDHDLVCAMSIDGNANARLIAAAPELLAALEQTITRFERCMVQAGSDPEFARAATQAARTVIATARGETATATPVPEDEG